MILWLFACKSPPDAPEGLDDSMTYLLREFYGDDATVGAGLTGLMDWFDEDGAELVGAEADLDSAGAFSLASLSADDVAHLPLPDDGRDVAAAIGVVSISDLPCGWTETEELLVRADQDDVFAGDFDTYERSYIGDRDAYLDAAETEDFDPIRDAFDPESDGFDLGKVARTLLFTENAAESTELGITIPLEFRVQFRHGIYEVQGEDEAAVVILSFTPEVATGPDGKNRMEQSYSIDINLARGGRTLRVFATWNEITSPWVASDSSLLAVSAVNKAQASAQRLSDICAGKIDL